LQAGKRTRSGLGAGMKSLWLRIYVALVATLLVFALAAAAIVHRQWTRERELARAQFEERMQTLIEVLEPALPPAGSPAEDLLLALQRWSLRMRVPLALEAADGRRLATTQRFGRREAADLADSPLRFALSDGRRLLVLPPMRPGMRLGPDGREAGDGRPPGVPGLLQAGLPALLVLLLMLFVAVALAAWPVARKLTRRLEVLKSGVERFGAGDLGQRVPEQGRDEVAALAHSFNNAATRIEQLVASHRSLLANASHELRSPLARLRMALAIRQDEGGGRAPSPLDAEIERNLRELDALVDEVLLASRLEAGAQTLTKLELDAVALAVEMAAQHGVERLLRRALRNLLENARRYGGAEAELQLIARGRSLEFRVLDRGPGVPAELRERIFEPFFRQPGHAEMAGGVGLGLSLVRQIAQAHGGRAWVEARDGGGAVFVLSLPRAFDSSPVH
jgi:signal transduction histidine kinase